MSLLKAVLEDLGHRCDVSTSLDLKTIEARVKHEGLEFLTIALPDFAKDLQKGLEQGTVDRRLFTGFRRKGELPRFLGGFLDLVFDRCTGRLLPEPSEDAIFSIRQATMLYGKLEGICTPSREKKAISDYLECERQVKEYDALRTPEMLSHFRSASARLLGRTINKVENQLTDWEFHPRHGPGATADRLKGNRKYNQHTWPQRLDRSFPASEFLIPSLRFLDDLSAITYLEPEAEIPARLISVPKTMKTPRLIAIEPTAMQYAQQSLESLLVSSLERGLDNPLPNLIGFTDQSLNREMAREGSITGTYATLDLSEASDRVSNQLVLAMTSWAPFLRDALQDSRSRKVDVPGHGVQRVAKFSSMGSAVCFPIEAMVFSSIILIGIERQHNRRLTYDEIHFVMGRVRIYGDDIIVPVEYASTVVQALEDFGLRVNQSKSFRTGKFRESCGGDFYNGVDVTPVRCKRLIPSRRQQAREIISAVSLRNRLYLAGLWRAAKCLDTILERLIPFPVVLEKSPVLGRVSYLGYETQKYDSHLHRPLVKGMVVEDKIPPSRLDGSGALLKYFLKRSERPLSDKHLEFAGRPVAVSIKRRWATPY